MLGGRARSRSCCRWHAGAESEPAHAGSRSGRPVGRSVLPAHRFLRSPFPGGSALIPPPALPSSVPAVQRPSVGGRPNHALQRTDHGVGAFSRWQPLRRHGPSLSLSPLDPESLAWGSPMARRFSFASRARWFPFALPVRPSSGHVFSAVQPFPAAAPIIPPPESRLVLPASSAL